MTPPGAPQGKGNPGLPAFSIDTLPQFCLTVPSLFQGTSETPLPALQRPTFFAESVQGQVLQQALAFPRNSPFYLSVFFRSTRDQSSPYLIRTDVFPRLPVNDASLGYPYDVESARYPLIHELSENLRLVEGNFNDLKEKEKELQRSVEKLTEWTLKSETERGPESTIEGEKRKIKRILKDMRRVLDGMDAPVKTLERWALQDGKDKAVSREAALDMVFGLYRANEAVAKNYPPAEVDAGYEVIRKTRERRYLKGSLDGLSFGVAVVDLNVTGPNSVNRDLGEIVLDQTYEALKAHFQGSVVSKGTRTNFRIVNPDGQKLSQEELLQLESDIHRRISKKVEGNPTWKAFIEGYHVGLSSGYAEVSFLPEEIRVGPQGEYEMESVNALLKKVDYGFRVAHARSQEITLKLKEEEAQKDLGKVERLHYGQMMISDLNGIPEGRFFEPGEAETAKRSPVRLVHSIRGLNGSLKPVRAHLNTVERFAEDPLGRKEMVRDVLLGGSAASAVLENVGEQYYSIAYDVSHDLRMPRLVERSFAAERVDKVIRETGGAHLMFVELGQFYSFVRSWYGGNEDRYVHELIYEFNKILVQKGMVLMHPANQAPLVDDKGRIAVDPKNGQYFHLNASHHDSVSGLRILRNPGTAFPVGSEVVLAMREGDELGFVVGDRKADGHPVTKDDLQEVFKKFDEVIRGQYGHMWMDDIQKVGTEKVRTPKWERLEWRNGKVQRHEVAQKDILMQEVDVTADYTGWVVDHEAVKSGSNEGAPKSGSAVEEAADVVVGRKMRWRYFENGEVSNKVFTGETISVSNKDAPRPSLEFPRELRDAVPELLKEPILAKMQTQLSAGYISVDLHSGAELDKAWADANDLSKKSKEKGGEPLFVEAKPNPGYKPQGHQYDKQLSGPRTLEIAKYFESYAKPGGPPEGLKLSPELKGFLTKHGKELARLSDPLKPKTFERQLQKMLKANVADPKLQAELGLQIEAQLAGDGALARVRDGFAVAQILKREGLSLDYKGLGPALWTSLDAAEKALPDGEAKEYLRENKARFVGLYVQQTGEMPPEEIVAEGKRFLDPRSVFIPKEIFSLAKEYHVAPERVPFMVAGLKADEIRKMGQEAFRGLNFEDLKKLADSPEGQAFLNNPKNSMLLRDTLSSRMAFQGVPLAASMATIFPTEMLCKYLAEKAGGTFKLSKGAVEELKFGMTLYFVHGINITTSGVWEVALNRAVTNNAVVRSKALDGVKGLAEVLRMRLNGGVIQGTRLAGQELVSVGVKSGDSLGKAMVEGVLEKWGWRTGAGTLSWKLAGWQLLGGSVRVPFNLLRTMGPGYLSATIFDRGAGIWLKPDNPVRKWGSFAAFFAPDIVSLALGSSRIAASPLLRGAGSLFTKAGNRLLAIAILNYGVKRLIVDDDYQGFVNRRVTDQIYDKHVYELDGWDFLVVPLAVKGLRAGSRFIAPDAMEWAVSADHGDIRGKILGEDLANSRQIKDGIKDLLPKLMALPVFYSLNQADSYRRLDFSALSKTVELDEKEKKLLQKMTETEGEIPETAFEGIPSGEKEQKLLKIQLYQIQQGARYLVAVRQPENAWAREVFNEDGTLIEGKGEKMLEKLHPTKAGEPSAVEKILTSRQVMVVLAMLDGKEDYQGLKTLEVARLAGVVDENKKLVLSPATYAGLTLYTTRAYESKGERELARVQDLIGKLQVAYLKADEKERSKYLDALRCLGATP